MSAPGNNPKNAGANARRTPRRIFKHPIGVLVNGEYNVFRAQQIGEGGMLFNATAIFRPGERLIATIILPGGGAVVARGEIIYERPAASEAGRPYGVKFAPLSIPARRAIRNYVTAKTQSESEAEQADD